MKKPLIITIGIMLILIVLAVWLYLLFFGTPNNSDDVFTNLGFSGAPTVTETIVDEPVENTENTQLATGESPLRQLTTRPVAGFTFVGTSTALIRYVERGTGYVFEINIDENSERRISGTTIPRTTGAIFSPDGVSVALITESGYTQNAVAGTLTEDETGADFITLPEGAYDLHFTSTHGLRYALKTNEGTGIYELDIRNTNPTQLFSIPFREVHILWSGDDVYTYNKPTKRFKGSLYQVGNVLKPETPGEFGFVGGINDDYYFGSAIINEVFSSYAIDRSTGERVALPITYIPEKCASVTTNGEILWCASPFETMGGDTLEDWYQGVEHLEDMLWLVNVTLGEARLTSNFLAESGRLVDVDKIEVDVFGATPIFRNKVDNTLWLYDTRIQ